MSATLDLAASYRLAPGVVIRPERFGGLAYRYDNRRLYCLRCPRIVEFVNALKTHASVQETLDWFSIHDEISPALIQTWLKTVTHLQGLGILIRD
jgi:putative mycofactocin binding protein MftB